MHAFIAGFLVGAVIVALIFAFRHAIITIAVAEYNKAKSKLSGDQASSSIVPPPPSVIAVPPPPDAAVVPQPAPANVVPPSPAAIVTPPPQSPTAS